MSATEKRRKKVAIVTELEWPLRRHYELVAGVQEYASKHADWQMEVSRFPEVQMETGKRFDGIIGRIQNETYKVATAAGTPLVNVMSGAGMVNEMHNVLVDAPKAGTLAGQHLVNRGMPRLLCIMIQGQKLTQLYTEGVRNVASPRGVPVRTCTLPEELEVSRENWRQTREKLSEALKGWKPPVGVLIHSDTASRAVITLLTDMGWRIPENLALVSMGNEETICTAIRPTISSIDLGHQRQGYDAAAMLDRLMHGERVPKRLTRSPPKGLIPRDSSDVFSVRDPEVQRALRFMAEHCDRFIGVPEITAETGIGRQTLERRFRNELNTSIYHELHRLRIERAKRLLVEDLKCPIKELCLQSGFSTMSNFYAAFKKHTGLSPAAYRKAHADPVAW